MVGWRVGRCANAIVDPVSGEDVGVGEPGELWFQDPNVMRGHLHDRDGTAATLTRDGRWRTGDVAFIDADVFVWTAHRLRERIKHKDLCARSTAYRAPLPPQHRHTSPSEQEVPHLGPGGITDIGCSYGNHNFAERSRVWFQACVGGAEPLTCGKTIVATTS